MLLLHHEAVEIGLRHGEIRDAAEDIVAASAEIDGVGAVSVRRLRDIECRTRIVLERAHSRNEAFRRLGDFVGAVVPHPGKDPPPFNFAIGTRGTRDGAVCLGLKRSLLLWRHGIAGRKETGRQSGQK